MRPNRCIVICLRIDGLPVEKGYSEGLLKKVTSMSTKSDFSFLDVVIVLEMNV